MANPGLTIEQCREALDTLAKFGNITAAAAALGMPRTTFQSRVFEARVLTYRNGRLLYPELCLVHSEDAGIVEFRGEEFVV